MAAEAPGLPNTIRTAPDALWVLASLAIVVDTLIVQFQRRRFWLPVMMSVTFCYSITYAFGYGTARITQAAAILITAGLARRPFWPTAFDIGRYGLALAAAATVTTLIGRPRPFEPGPVDLLGVLGAALAWYVAFRVLTATEAWLSGHGTWLDALRRNVPAEAVSAAALLLLSPMLVLLATTDVWLVPLVLAPLLAVSQLARMYALQEERARRDPLTGLPNRLAMSQDAVEPIRRCAEGQEAGFAALLVVDVAQLSRVNQARGHRVGDAVLVAVAQLLANRAGPHALVARLHGDEFGVLMWPLAGVDEVFTSVAAFHRDLDEPLSVDGGPVSVSASIGVALCPQHGDSFYVLERHADSALVRAKATPQRVAIFRPDRDAPTADQVTLLTDLHRALEEPRTGQIVPFYQPQVDMSTNEVVGAEALLRWRHPTRGMVSPDEIIRVAEQSPLMAKVTATMMDQMLAQLASWRARGWTINASLNVSTRELHDVGLVDWLDGRLRHYGIPPSQIQLEVTESALLNEAMAILDTLTELRRLGVGASLDDFGTGFSSLQHLRRLPLTEVKIDRSFVESMMENPRDEAIVCAVIDLARDLGLRVVAEGVEDERTRARLLADGCRFAQGWYYAAPMPADEFDLWCAQGHRPPAEPHSEPTRQARRHRRQRSPRVP